VSVLQINAIGTMIVEVELSNGLTGVGVTSTSALSLALSLSASSSVLTTFLARSVRVRSGR
jgi:hypothetical protein